MTDRQHEDYAAICPQDAHRPHPMRLADLRTLLPGSIWSNAKVSELGVDAPAVMSDKLRLEYAGNTGITFR